MQNFSEDPSFIMYNLNRFPRVRNMSKNIEDQGIVTATALHDNSSPEDVVASYLLYSKSNRNMGSSIIQQCLIPTGT
jgi:hypothetical protein